jgi:lipopolysaccharide transport system ATP-binding protein
MSNILEVHNVSKQYRLGTVGTGTLSHDLNRWWHKVRGKEDPYLKIGSANDRSAKADSDYVWALQDISFNVKEGEVLGIIGKNGAGKSTLLKILSRVTGPTTGSIKAYGRIASLLEVGTGFHPELTGRENIYLNGAILGMSKAEIRSKFDEIVDFSGCERYIDTPVKRYSSGMYVRLAFAVAAHLEPEILIVDEVLAVGDAEFQKKALGKMKDISTGQGRTVLFVSHNMAAVQALCNTCVFLQNGLLHSIADTETIISQYLKGSISKKKAESKTEFTSEHATLVNATIKGESSSDIIYTDTSFTISFIFEIHGQNLNLNASMNVHTLDDIHVLNSMSNSILVNDGQITFVCKIPSSLLNAGQYRLSIILANNRNICLSHFKDILTLEIADSRQNESYFGQIGGIIRPNLEWNIKL